MDFDAKIVSKLSQQGIQKGKAVGKKKLISKKIPHLRNESYLQKIDQNFEN
jgi:hypothetical protein